MAFGSVGRFRTAWRTGASASPPSPHPTPTPPPARPPTSTAPAWDFAKARVSSATNQSTPSRPMVSATTGRTPRTDRLSIWTTTTTTASTTASSTPTPMRRDGIPSRLPGWRRWWNRMRCGSGHHLNIATRRQPIRTGVPCSTPRPGRRSRRRWSGGWTA